MSPRRQLIFSITAGLAVGACAGMLLHTGTSPENKRNSIQPGIPAGNASAGHAPDAPVVLDPKKVHPLEVTRGLLLNLGCGEEEVAELISFVSQYQGEDPCVELHEKMKSMGFDASVIDKGMWGLLAVWMQSRESIENPRGLLTRLLSKSERFAGALWNGYAFTQPSEYIRGRKMEASRFLIAADAAACLADPGVFRDVIAATKTPPQEIWDSISTFGLHMPEDILLAAMKTFAAARPGVECRLPSSEDSSWRLAAALFGRGGGALEAAQGEEKEMPRSVVAAGLIAGLNNGNFTVEQLMAEKTGRYSALGYLLEYGGDEKSRSQLAACLVDSLPALSSGSQGELLRAGSIIGAYADADSLRKAELSKAPADLRLAVAAQMLIRGFDGGVWKPLVEGSHPDVDFAALAGGNLEAAWKLQETSQGMTPQRADLAQKWMREDPLQALKTAGNTTNIPVLSELRRGFSEWIGRDSWGASIALLEIKDPAILGWAVPLLADAIQADDPEAAASWRAAIKPNP